MVGIGGGTAGAAGIGKAITGGEVAKLQRQVAEFEMPEVVVPDVVERVGKDNLFTGGVEDPKRKRRSEDSYAEVLAGYSPTSTYFG